MYVYTFIQGASLNRAILKMSWTVNAFLYLVLKHMNTTYITWNERETYWFLPRAFVSVCGWWWSISAAYCHWGWELGTILWARKKATSMEWRHTSSPKPKQVRVQRSAGKAMFTFFWEYDGPILEHYMLRGSTVTSATYSNLLRENLKPAIRQKWRGFLTTGVCLLHENARPHTATETVSTIQKLRFECIPQPLYSPDLAPSDFHVFGPLKDALSGTQFREDEEV